MDNFISKVYNTLNIIKIPANPAIVFDIDDTLITSGGRCIQQTIDFYNYVKSRGIKTVIITNRGGTKDVIKYTIKQLDDCGVGRAEYMYFRLPDKDNPYRYKEKSRKNAHEEMGLNIIMSLGDMPWDIGNYGGYGFIVPIV